MLARSGPLLNMLPINKHYFINDFYVVAVLLAKLPIITVATSLATQALVTEDPRLGTALPISRPV